MTDINELLKRSVAAVKAMTPEQREAMFEAQRKSWVRAMTTPCEHGVLDFEQCGACRDAARARQDSQSGRPFIYIGVFCLGFCAHALIDWLFPDKDSQS